MTENVLPALPSSWSSLTWEQLKLCWRVKIHYGGNTDAARVAALLALLGLSVERGCGEISKDTGEKQYRLRDKGKGRWTTTAREISYLAKQAIPWFDYPYGDPGVKEQRDDKGKLVREGRDAVPGYVSPMRDAMMLPQEELRIRTTRLGTGRWFQLPQVACNNLTWQQYRALQTITPQLFTQGISEAEASGLRASFLSNCLLPRTLAVMENTGGSIRIRLHYEYAYSPTAADGLARWFRKKMTAGGEAEVLFHICFQVYQTALSYYASAYPLLFGSGGDDQVKDALQGEVGTINTIMKYAGYSEQQQVYDSNLPFVLDILNTMAKEAKELENIKSKSKR